MTRTMPMLNRYTDEREFIEDSDDALEDFYATHDPHEWIPDPYHEDDDERGEWLRDRQIDRMNQ